jgi:hypothetical protein
MHAIDGELRNLCDMSNRKVLRASLGDLKRTAYLGGLLPYDP